MKRILIITLIYLLLIIGLSLFLTAPQDQVTVDYDGVMATSNQLYEMGEYALAVEGYQQLVDSGIVDTALYYNLGNAFYKQGDLGHAVLNYLRAQRLQPRDEDIRANLEMARNLRVDKLDENSTTTKANPFTQLTQSWLTMNELSILALSLWYLLSVLIITLFNSKPESRRREVSFYAILLVALLFAGSAFSLISQVIRENQQPQAVVIADEVDVTSGPGTQYVTEFTLHSGTEVNLLETRVNWARLSLPGGELQGWVPEDVVERVEIP